MPGLTDDEIKAHADWLVAAGAAETGQGSAAGAQAGPPPITRTGPPPPGSRTMKNFDIQTYILKALRRQEGESDADEGTAVV